MLLTPLYTLSIAENVFGSFVEWVTNLVSDLFDGVSLAFCNLTMPDMTAFSQSFSFLTTAFEAIKYFALALLFLIVIFQLFKAFGGKIVEAEDPAVLIVRAMFFGTMIFFAQPIFDTLLDIAMVPYQIFDGQHGFLEDSVSSGQFSDLVGPNGFGAFFSVLGLFAGSGIIITLILSLVLFWNYLKLLLEVVERYIVLGILYYTSPLAFSLGASKVTSDVFKNWCRMVGSELFIVIMNVWFLRGFSSGLGYFVATLGGAEDPSNPSNALIRMLVGYFSLLAYLRVASKFDEYLNQLGLNAAKTGGGPLGGIGAMMALRPVMRALTGGGGFFGGGGGGKAGAGAGAASKILGAGGGVAGIPSKAAAAFKPGTYVGNAVGGSKQGFGGLVGAVANTAGKAYAATHGLGDVGQISRLANSTNSALNSIAGKAGLNDAQAFMPGIFNRSGLNYNSGAQMNSPGKMSGEFTDANGNRFGVVASSMRANDAPQGAFGVARAADGSGFYVQALDRNGNVSEEGMAAIFGAPTIGNGEGQIPSGNFGNSFFPHQENTTSDLSFQNDPNDPFTLHATDANGNEFTYRSGAAYDSDGIDTADAMVLTDANGQTWFAEDSSALNTNGLEDGVTIGSDGTVLDADGNFVSNDVANSLSDTDSVDMAEAGAAGIAVDGGADMNGADINGTDVADATMSEGAVDIGNATDVNGADVVDTAMGDNAVDIGGADISGADVADTSMVEAAVIGSEADNYADMDVASGPAIAPETNGVDISGTDTVDTSVGDNGAINTSGIDVNDTGASAVGEAVGDNGVSNIGNTDVADVSANDAPVVDNSNVVDFHSGSQDTDANVDTAVGEREYATVGAPADIETGSVDTQNGAAYEAQQNSADVAQGAVDGQNNYTDNTSGYTNEPNSVSSDAENAYSGANDGIHGAADDYNGDHESSVHNTENAYNDNTASVNNDTDQTSVAGYGGGIASGGSTAQMSDADIAQKQAIEKSNNSVASFFGLDANKIQYADTSKKDEGIVTVHNKDGSSSMFVADKGGHEVSGPSTAIRSSNNQTWREVKGTRGVEQRYTGKRDENGNPVTQNVPTVKYDASVTPKQNGGPQNRFSARRTQQANTQTPAPAQPQRNTPPPRNAQPQRNQKPKQTKNPTQKGGKKNNGGSKGGKKGGKK